MFLKNSESGVKTSKKCDHPYIRKGYYLGLNPEEYVCVYCGEHRMPEQWDDFERRRMPPAGMLNATEPR